MLRWVICILCLCLAACGRPVTERESAFLDALVGDTLDRRAMRIVDGNPAGAITYTIPVRPRVTCQERIWPPLEEATRVRVSPIASVVFNTLFLRGDVYRDDMMAGYPAEFDLAQTMLLAHEAVHVWQWQNRARTGYHPLRGLGEHFVTDDPYLFDPDANGRRFLDYGYEQQGALVEEYVCCFLLDPAAPRTARLRALIGQELPVAGLDRAVGAASIRLPWAGVEPEGICRGPAE